MTFQSTLPVRGATREGCAGAEGGSISIHAPRTGSDLIAFLVQLPASISIHAPRTGSDSRFPDKRRCSRISIHAPRTGSDKELADINRRSKDPAVAPRTGSDPGFGGSLKCCFGTQPSLPVRGATRIPPAPRICCCDPAVAPRTGSDLHIERGIAYEKDPAVAPRTGSDSKNSQKVTLFLRQLNNFPKYHLGFPFLSRPTAFFSRKSVKKRSAKSPVFLVRLPFASKQSAHPREHRRPSPQNVRFCFHSGFQDSKTAGCPSPGP